MDNRIISRSDFLKLSPDERAEYFLKAHKELLAFCAPGDVSVSPSNEEKMKYNVRIDVKETDSGSVFVARYPVLEGVSGTGATQVEALHDLEENAEAHIEFMKMDGEEPPASEKHE